MGPWGYSKSSKSWTTLGSLRSPSRRTIADSSWQHGRRSLGFRLNGGNEEAWPCSVEQTAWGCTQSGKRETESRSWTCYAATTTFDRQYLLVFQAMLATLMKPCFISQRRFCFVTGMTHKIASCWIYCHERNECMCFLPSNLIFDGSKV